MSLKIALINVGFGPEEKMVGISPPLGILHIGAYLRDNSFDVNLFDWCGEPLDANHRAALDHYGPQIVGITVTISSSISRAITVSRWAKESGATVVWGGPGPTSLPGLCLKDAPVDFVVIGEGEETMLDLCRSLERNADFTQVDGIAFLRDGRLTMTRARKRILRLDDLPLPMWEGLGDLRKYIAPFYGRNSIPMSTSRGCPNSCTFCYTKAMWGYAWCGKSAGRIVEEIEKIIRIEPSIDAFSFEDDLFVKDKQRIYEFCKIVKKRGLDIIWNCGARAKDLDPDILKEMKEAGCRQVLIGVESGSQRILDLMKKGVTIDKIREAFEMVQRAGMDAFAFIMLGLPYETRSELKATEKFLKKIRADGVEFKVYMPYPGTEMFEVAKEKGFKEPDSLLEWDKRSDVLVRAIYERNFSEAPAEEIVKMIERIQKFVRLRSYWKEFSKNPFTSPVRALRFIAKIRS
ncbi:MAG: radical SAM protein [Methanomassiliicoccales archaeon]|jgi:anaerobic magnesium-protoporphyrin IX monomethyl ester cyclase|nr:radical SAM protein [Methanomassiliicoccales archaeon]